MTVLLIKVQLCMKIRTPQNKYSTGIELSQMVLYVTAHMICGTHTPLTNNIGLQ